MNGHCAKYPHVISHQTIELLYSDPLRSKQLSKLMQYLVAIDKNEMSVVISVQNEDKVRAIYCSI